MDVANEQYLSTLVYLGDGAAAALHVGVVLRGDVFYQIEN
jgi:hypothetical protein